MGCPSYRDFTVFSTGLFKNEKAAYTTDAFSIGKCETGESLTACTGGGNYRLYSRNQKKKCYAGQEVKIAIICTNSGNSHGVQSSCDGRWPITHSINTDISTMIMISKYISTISSNFMQFREFQPLDPHGPDMFKDLLKFSNMFPDVWFYWNHEIFY